jgi:cysteine-rich repeat protein
VDIEPRAVNHRGMQTTRRWSPLLTLSLSSCLVLACNDDTGTTGASTSESGSETNAGDGDGDETSSSVGDGDGDGDGTPGDGDGTPGDGDGTPGDGDGTPGDGDGTPGDGDGAPAVCGDGVVEGDEVCDDGVNDGSYDGCNPDCLSRADYCGDAQTNGPEACDDGVNDGSYGTCNNNCTLADYCGDAVLNGNEVCDDGVNDGSYDGCANDCSALAEFCGDGAVNGPEPCDDGNADSADGCLASCIIPQSCLVIHDYDNQAASGNYIILPDNLNNVDPFTVYCDMVSDGGGYTFLKVNAGVQHNAAQAETACANWGMQLWIPRSLAHKDAGWGIANAANIGPDASADYMRILGIYPEFNGATCANQPMNSTNMNCRWEASDGFAWYVHAVNNISEPNGDNSVTGSMYYQWQGNGAIQWHNDIAGAGYTSSRYMCDTADKLP